METERWLLPEGIDELLPPEAVRLEVLRRELLDLFETWGYELVIPPFIEYLESLLTGTGRDLDLKTFKLTDQVSGRQLGIRADMTPQAARIDAHRLRRDVPTRLCYLGTVLHTMADGFGGTRSPMQVGAELYGHGGIESDVEVLLLMLATLETSGVRALYLDLGHVGIFRGLARQARLAAAQEIALFEALQRKAIPDVRQLVQEFAVAEPVAGMLHRLAELNGGESVIAEARTALASAAGDVQTALDYLAGVADALKARRPDIPVHYDLAELRAYQYQTGIVFGAFAPGQGTELARGGRYDDIGKAFGRARPATGFSADLRAVLQLTPRSAPAGPDAVFAPWNDDPVLLALVDRLRAQGLRIVWQLPGQAGDAAAMGCRRVIRRRGDVWAVEDD
jgi:ATP phosphoribosyltransferase regulatory subunit